MYIEEVVILVLFTVAILSLIVVGVSSLIGIVGFLIAFTIDITKIVISRFVEVKPVKPVKHPVEPAIVRSPIHEAVLNNNRQGVSMALSTGNVIEAKDKNGHTPLILAVSMNKESMVRTLLKAGANTEAACDNKNTTALIMAVMMNNVSMVQMLLEAGANIKASHQDGFTALHFAVLSGSPLIVDKLLEEGAVIEARSYEGITALHCAAFKGHPVIVNQLLEKSANVNAKTNTGKSAYDFTKDENVKQLLIRYGYQKQFCVIC